MTWDVPHLMTGEEVAERLGVAPSALGRLRRERGLVGVLIGREYRYHPDDVRDWIDRQRAITPADVVQHNSTNGAH